MSAPIVAGQTAADRLMGQLDYRIASDRTRLLSRAEVAVVLHALADYTALESAMRHVPDRPGNDGPATSVGRWLHDVADDLERTPEAPPVPLASHRPMGPLAAEHHMVGNVLCGGCHAEFATGDYLVLIYLGPGADEEQREAAREGRAYTSLSQPVHWSCATGWPDEAAAWLQQEIMAGRVPRG